MHYYYDKIEIISCSEVPELKRALRPLLDDNKIKITQPSSDKARLAGFKSKIILSAPDVTILQSLKNYETEFSPYSISYIELAEDTECDTEQEADILAATIIRTLSKRYTAKVFLYDGEFFGSGEDYREKGLYGSKSLNLGKDFKYATYARRSKTSENHVLHQEWRIRTARIIKKKTFIKTISDLIEFDIERFSTDQAKRQLFHAEIDMEKLGKWLMGWSRRKTFTKSEKMKIDLAALAFCKMINERGVNDITYAQLDEWFKNEKAKIKNRGRGRPSKWDKKILTKDQRRFRKLVSSPLL